MSPHYEGHYPLSVSVRVHLAHKHITALLHRRAAGGAGAAVRVAAGFSDSLCAKYTHATALTAFSLGMKHESNFVVIGTV